MSIYLRWRTIVACLVAAVGTAAAIAPADAADPPLPTAAPPAVSYAFGSFARGPLVLEDGGAFEVRSDGCWTTRFAISNTGAIAVAATVYYSWVDATGRQIAEIEVLDDTTYGPGTTTPFEAAACSRSIAASYARLSQASVRRTLEVDD